MNSTNSAMHISNLLNDPTTPPAPATNQPPVAHSNEIPPVDGRLHLQGRRWGAMLKGQFVAFTPESANRLQQMQQAQPQIQADMQITADITPDPNDPQKVQARTVVGGAHLLLNTTEFEQQPIMQNFGRSFRNFIEQYRPDQTQQDGHSTSVQPQAVGTMQLPGGLATETWLQTAKELPVADKKSLRKVSRAMERIANDTVEAVRIRNANDMGALRTFSYTRKITLSGPSITRNDLLSVIQHMQNNPNATELDLHNCGHIITDADLQQIVQTLPQLTRLSLPNCKHITDAGLLPLQQAQQNNYLPNLTYLDLSHSHQIGNITMQSVRNLPNLTHLSVSHCPQIDSRAMQLVGQMNNLTNLDVSGCRRITDSDIAHIGNLTGLTHLDMGGCSLITDIGIQALTPNLTNLTKLNLEDCELLTGAGMQHLTNLTDLNLSRCSEFNDHGLAQLGNLTALTRLNLEGCNLVTDTGIQALTTNVRNLRNLTDLNLEDCERLTDASMRHLTNLTGLTRLSVRNCYEITDAGVQHLRPLASLTYLNLSMCRKITNIGAGHLASLTNLTYLNLEECLQITNPGVQNLRPLTNLTHLHLGYCNLRDPVFNYFAPYTAPDNPDQTIQPFSKLIELDFTHCLNITKTTNLKLLSRLESVNFTACKRLTDLSGLEGLPHLKSVNLMECKAIGDKGSDLVYLRTLPSLTSLHVGECHLTQPQLLQVGQLSTLRSLNIERTNFSNGSLQALVTLTNLTNLNLFAASLPNADLHALGRLSNLRKLNISYSKIPPNDVQHMGLPFLPYLTNLTTLNLDASKHVGAIDLLNLPQLSKLKDLNLSDCGYVTDAFLQQYAQQPNKLSTLSLNICVKITDRAVPFLQQLHALSTLEVRGTRLSPNAIQHLRAAIPNVESS